jgi:hypothetical protein
MGEMLQMHNASNVQCRYAAMEYLNCSILTMLTAASLEY